MAIEVLTNPSSTIQNISATAGANTSYQGQQDTVHVEKSNQTEQNGADQNQSKEQGGYEIENAADVSAEKIKKAVEDMNQRMKPTRTSCQFSFHEETNRISIKVIDDNEDKVIREIPGEKALDIIAKTLELEGLLLDEKR